MPRTPLLACLLACSGATPAADLPPVSADAVRAHVEFLADDLLEGRVTGSRGYDLAARYVASQMRAIGLLPAGDHGGWLQEVRLLEANRVLPAAELVVTLAGAQDALKPVADFIPGYYFFGNSSAIEAPMAYVGYGIHAPGLGHDDFAGIDLRGRIAVVLAGAPQQFPNSERAHYSSRAKTEGLIERGAVGVVTLDTPAEEVRVPWARKAQLSWVPRMRLVDGNGQPLDAYPTLLGTASVSAAAAARLFAGSPLAFAEAVALAERGESRSFELPARLRIGLKNALAPARSANVVGLLPGADPALAGEYLVFTAHLDHLGRGAAVNGDAIYNGALDNAAGVAITLETARALVNSPVRPRRSILFVAVTAEERGLLGSDYFARNPTVPRGSLVANINTDMPTALYPVSDMVLFGAQHTTLGGQARAALAAEGLGEAADESPEEVFFVRSDQYSFVRQGIPAIMVDTGNSSSDPAVDVRAVTRQFLLRDYHMPSDSPALPIHWPSLARHARVNARLALAVANADERPAWLPGDFFGETFAPAVAAGGD